MEALWSNDHATNEVLEACIKKDFGQKYLSQLRFNKMNMKNLDTIIISALIGLIAVSCSKSAPKQAAEWYTK